MAIKKETLLIFIIAAFILVYNTIIIEPYRPINYTTKLLIIASLFIFFRHSILSGRQLIVIFLYSILLVYGLSIAALNQKFALSVPLFLKYSFRFLSFSAILMILNQNRYSDSVIKMPMWIGVILSIQSVLLFAMIASGNQPEVSYVDHNRGLLRSYGIWGFAPSITWGYNNLRILRVSSFFSEASNFARFLEYPIILSLGYYKIYGGKRYLLALTVCLLSFILTFSMTGYLAVFLGCFVFYVIKKTNIFAIFIIPICLVLFVLSLHVYLKNAYVANPHERSIVQHMLLSKYGEALRSTEDLRGFYGGRVYSAIEASKVFIENPLGVGLLDNRDIDILYRHGDEDYTSIHLYGAFWNWLIKTGFIGISLFVLIFYTIIREMKTFWHNKTDIRCYTSLAFICISIHHLIAGDWIDPMFLFVMSSVLAYKKKELLSSAYFFQLHKKIFALKRSKHFRTV